MKIKKKKLKIKVLKKSVWFAENGKKKVNHNVKLTRLSYLYNVYKRWHERKVLMYKCITDNNYLALQTTNGVLQKYLNLKKQMIAKGLFGIFCNINRKNMLFSVVDATGKVYTRASSGSVGIQYRPHKISDITTEKIIQRLRFKLRRQERRWEIPYLTFIKTKGYPFWYYKNLISSGFRCGLTFGSNEKEVILNQQQNILKDLNYKVQEAYPDLNLVEQSLTNMVTPLLPKTQTQLLLIATRPIKPHNGTRRAKKRTIKRHYAPRAYFQGVIKELPQNLLFKNNLVKLEKRRFQEFFSFNPSIKNPNIFVLQVCFDLFFQFYIFGLNLHWYKTKKYNKLNFNDFVIKVTRNKKNVDSFMLKKGSLKISQEYKKLLKKYVLRMYKTIKMVRLWNFFYQENARLIKTNEFYNYLLPFNLLKENNGRTLKLVLEDDDKFATFIKYFYYKFKWAHFSTFLPDLIKIFSKYHFTGGLPEDVILVKKTNSNSFFKKEFIGKSQELLKDGRFLQLLFYLNHTESIKFKKSTYKRRLRFLLRLKSYYSKRHYIKDLFYKIFILPAIEEQKLKKKNIYFLSKKAKKKVYKELRLRYVPFENKILRFRVKNIKGFNFYKIFIKYFKQFRLLNNKYNIKKKFFTEKYSYKMIKKLLSKQEFKVFCNYLTVDRIRREAIIFKSYKQLSRLNTSHQKFYIESLGVVLNLKKPNKK